MHNIEPTPHASAIAEGRALVEAMIAKHIANDERLQLRQRAASGDAADRLFYRAAEEHNNAKRLRAFLADYAALTQQLAALREAVEKLPRFEPIGCEGDGAEMIADPQGPMIDRAAVLSLFDRSPETNDELR